MAEKLKKINRGVKENMNDINNLKQKIEKIKEERKKYLAEIKRIFKTDSCLRSGEYINRKYIIYILSQTHQYKFGKYTTLL